MTVISLSGALAPGPLTVATATSGLKSGWKAGLWASIGHTLIELPYVILISLGLLTIFKNPKVNLFLGILGSIFLFLFGYSTIRDALRGPKLKESHPKRNTIPTAPFLTGIFLTLLNPYFLAWWIGIGASLISEAMEKAGFLGIGLLYISHIWLDYAWLIFIARLASLGHQQIKVFRFILLGLGILVIWFGITLLVKTLGIYL